MSLKYFQNICRCILCSHLLRLQWNNPPARRHCLLEQVRLIAHIKQNHPVWMMILKKISHNCYDNCWSFSWLEDIQQNALERPLKWQNWCGYCVLQWDKSKERRITLQIQKVIFFVRFFFFFWKKSYFMLLWFIGLVIEPSSCHMNGDLWELTHYWSQAHFSALKDASCSFFVISAVVLRLP